MVMDEISIVATAMIFLLAGYDTTSTTLGYAALELARNPDIQKKAQQEVDLAFQGLFEDQKNLQGYFTVLQQVRLKLFYGSKVL